MDHMSDGFKIFMEEGGETSAAFLGLAVIEALPLVLRSYDEA